MMESDNMQYTNALVEEVYSQLIVDCTMYSVQPYDLHTF